MSSLSTKSKAVLSGTSFLLFLFCLGSAWATIDLHVGERDALLSFYVILFGSLSVLFLIATLVFAVSAYRGRR